MGRLIERTGCRYGRWTVLERHPNNDRSGAARWLCMCTCGATQVIRGKDLDTGYTRACRKCSARDRTMAWRRSLTPDVLQERFHRSKERRLRNHRAYYRRKRGLPPDSPARSHRHELGGMQFGAWTVLRFGGRDKYGHFMWTCRCACGGEAAVARSSLERGISTRCRSCGTAGRKSRRTTVTDTTTP